MNEYKYGEPCYTRGIGDDLDLIEIRSKDSGQIASVDAANFESDWLLRAVKCVNYCAGVKVPDNVGGLAVVYKKLLVLKEALHGITPPKSWPSLAVETALAQFEEKK